jgi:phosphoribosylpyrophosphate synthetase
METLIAHPNFAYLRDQIVEKNPATTKIGEVIHQRFADNWPNLKIHSVREDIEHQSITYLADFSEPELFFENYAMIRGVLDYYADKVRIIVPYFPVGTMERISEK